MKQIVYLALAMFFCFIFFGSGYLLLISHIYTWADVPFCCHDFMNYEFFPGLYVAQIVICTAEVGFLLFIIFTCMFMQNR